tara:strand:+ start:18071 stop:18511 length:441 start_codon:yes stop_codon:yes gene_type:complete
MNDKKLIRLIREEYNKRLMQVEIAARIAEAELLDKNGNLLISKDLKVKHKTSGYEYTVDQVTGEDEDMLIFLRSPDTPRVQPPDIIKRMNELDADGLIGSKDKESEIRITNIEMPNGESVAGLENQDLGDIFSITAKEFKKDYKVD